MKDQTCFSPLLFLDMIALKKKLLRQIFYFEKLVAFKKLSNNNIETQPQILDSNAQNGTLIKLAKPDLSN